MLDSLSQLYLPGAVTMWCALFFGLAAFYGYTRARHGDHDTLAFARRGYLFFTLSIVLGSLVLALCLMRRDFRIEYVYQYSGLDLPFHFQLAAFWAGQKGSFLIWLLFGVLLGVPLSRSAGRAEPTVMAVYILTLFGLLFILVRENPFVMLAETPVDGTGLNPLLQDDWMVIHPPVMFIGYAAGAIPFAFAAAAMWRRDTSTWVNRAFPWTLGGFLVLGTAILMGGYWAYKTLGWGGYWGWDPVENASLIPWLLGTVLIHGMYLERTKGRYRRANLVIACLLYLSVLYGTFLTRSGVLADFSVHSFVDLGISRFLLLWMGFFLFASLYLLVTRLSKVETNTNEDPLLSRGLGLVLSTVVVTVSAVLVTVGTSAPLLTRFQENPAQVGPEWYNKVHLPLAILVGLLLALIPFLTWKGTPASELLRKLVPSLGVALAITAVAAISGVEQPFHLLYVFLAGAALAANLQKVITMARAGGLANAGGYLAHVGVGIMLLGVLASSAYDQSAKVTLEQGVPRQVGDDLTLTFERYVPRQGREKEHMEVRVARDDGFTYLARPKFFLNDRSRQLMVNPDVKNTLLRDFYISPIQYEPGQPPGVDHRMQLGRGETTTAGDLTIRFVDFNLSDTGDPQLALADGGLVTLGADLEVRSGDGEAVSVTALYRFSSGGQVQTPPVELPGGGMIAMTGINPGVGKVQLDVAGIGSVPQKARLSLDVTRKPLIKMVWYGLYVVLAGGLLSTWKRYKTARLIDAKTA
ncbi:MAG: cytochrome c biogenesis protein CcsA [bacterium]|nr:cytochrome c biogenesis protein CcsA [bacterium]